MSSDVEDIAEHVSVFVMDAQEKALINAKEKREELRRKATSNALKQLEVTLEELGEMTIDFYMSVAADLNRLAERGSDARIVRLQAQRAAEFEDLQSQLKLLKEQPDDNAALQDSYYRTFSSHKRKWRVLIDTLKAGKDEAEPRANANANANANASASNVQDGNATPKSSVSPTPSPAASPGTSPTPSSTRKMGFGFRHAGKSPTSLRYLNTSYAIDEGNIDSPPWSSETSGDSE